MQLNLFYLTVFLCSLRASEPNAQGLATSTTSLAGVITEELIERSSPFVQDMMRNICTTKKWYYTEHIIDSLLEQKEEAAIEAILSDERFDPVLTLCGSFERGLQQVAKLLLSRFQGKFDETIYDIAFESAVPKTGHGFYNLTVPGMENMLKIWQLIIGHPFSDQTAVKVESTMLKVLNTAPSTVYKYKILDLMMSSPIFPVEQPNKALSMQWYHTLKTAIGTEDFILLRKITADWKEFKDRVNILEVPADQEDLISKASKLRNSSILVLLTSRIKVYFSLANECLVNPQKMETIESKMPAAFIQGLQSENENDAQICPYMTRLRDQNPHSVMIQATCMLSTCFVSTLDATITGAIRDRNEVLIEAALVAGKLKLEHLPELTEVSDSLLQKIDAAFGPVDLANIMLPEHGRACPFMLVLSNIGSYRVNRMIANLMAETSSLGNMEFIKKSLKVVEMFNCEESVRRSLHPALQHVFVKDPSKIVRGDEVFYLVLALYNSACIETEMLARNLLCEVQSSVRVEAFKVAVASGNCSATYYIAKIMAKLNDEL